MSYTPLSAGLVVRDSADCMLTSDAANMPVFEGVACAHCTSANTVLDTTTTGGFISYCATPDCAEAAVVFECSNCRKLTAQWIGTDACGWSALSTGPIDRQEAERAAAQAHEREIGSLAFGAGAKSHRAIEAALHVLEPHLTDGLIFEMVTRLSTMRPEFCGCLEAIEKDSYRQPHDKRLASELSFYLTASAAFAQGNACVGCHAYRCPPTLKEGGTK